MIQIIHGPFHIPYQMTPRQQQMFEYCAISGEVWHANVDGVLEACWGVIPPSFMSDHAYLWMLNLPVRHPFLLVRHSRKVIAILHERWPLLHGHCHRASDSFRWMLWLGAEFYSAQGDLVPFELRSRNG